jgi:hypothetical protein
MCVLVSYILTSRVSIFHVSETRITGMFRILFGGCLSCALSVYWRLRKIAYGHWHQKQYVHTRVQIHISIRPYLYIHICRYIFCSLLPFNCKNINIDLNNTNIQFTKTIVKIFKNVIKIYIHSVVFMRCMFRPHRGIFRQRTLNESDALCTLSIVLLKCVFIIIIIIIIIINFGIVCCLFFLSFVLLALCNPFGVPPLGLYVSYFDLCSLWDAKLILINSLF